MLRSIHIENFAIASRIELELNSGLSVITGETGAGKSILLDALGLALGERADSAMVKPDADKADISLLFDIDTLPLVQEWLNHNHIEHDGHQLVIRRTLTKEGRTKALINGQMATSAQLKSLGECLIQIHGQNQHQMLTKSSEQLRLLDEFANNVSEREALKNAFQTYTQLCEEKIELQKQVNQDESYVNLLKYQVEELQALNLIEGELQHLDQKHHLLSNAGTLIQLSTHLKGLLGESEDISCEQLLNMGLKRLEPYTEKFKSLEQISICLNDALIQIEEAMNALCAFEREIQFDEAALEEIEQRLSLIYDIARKNRVKPEALYEHHQKRVQELKTIEEASELFLKIDENIQVALKEYEATAKILSETRKKAAYILSSEITQCIKPLGMQDGQFQILFGEKPLKPSINGLDIVTFCFSANCGHPLKPLSKVASGGEMSRISLATQLIFANSLNTPTLIFDEVDTGIGGQTGSMVGQALRALGSKAQVLCVTHLPQVAAKAHQHFYVYKQKSKGHTTSQIRELSSKERLDEIARMLGADKETAHSALEHAKNLLEKT